jgi:hypothetical protein
MLKFKEIAEGKKHTKIGLNFQFLGNFLVRRCRVQGTYQKICPYFIVGISFEKLIVEVDF